MPRSVKAEEIARLVKGELVGDPDLVISGVAKIEDAGEHQLSFVSNPKYAKYLDESKAGVILISAALTRKSGTAIIVDNPYLAFVTLLEHFYPATLGIEPGVHKTAFVHGSAIVGEGATIGAHCVIEAEARVGARTIIHPHTVVSRNVSVGDDCIVHSNVSLRHDVILGNRVIIQNGAVIGSDGFGFAPEEQAFHKIPQVGNVIVEDDVEIGANTTVDRATLGSTVIKRGTKIDNLCQIAHNVVIGEHCVVAAQTGIAGSTVIGDGCKLGGQVGIVGHLKIGAGSMFGAQSGVSNSLEAGSIVSGSPARPIALWRRIEASLSRLPALMKRVREIEKQLENSKINSGGDSL